MKIKSKLYRKEEIKNTNRRYGSSKYYYPLWVEERDGNPQFALFTTRELEIAMDRGSKNPEDIRLHKPIYKQFFNWLLKQVSLRQ